MCTRRKIVIGVAAAVLAGIVWYATRERGEEAPTIPMGTVERERAPESLPAGVSGKLGPNAIVVHDQQPGNEVIVTVATIAAPGYVVIHEMVNGRPGAVLGNSALIEDGMANNLVIVLKRAMRDGEEFVAMLHTEKGAAGFDVNADLPVRDAADTIIQTTFRVSKNAPDPRASEIRY